MKRILSTPPPTVLAGASAAVCGLLLAAQLTAAPLSFQRVEIDGQPPTSPYVKLAGDFNGDGRLDIAIGGAQGPLVWYVNPGWQKVHIADGGWKTVAGGVGDVDGDGDPDIVPGAQMWFENPRPKGDPAKDPWPVHGISDIRSHDALVADPDRDGRLDVVARDQSGFQHNAGNAIHFWRQSARDRWEQHTLECPHGEGLALADLDRDGDVDVVIAGCWFENPGRMAADWRKHIYTSRWTWADAKVAVGDLDGNGHPDIALAPAEYKGQSYRLAWYESPGNAHDAQWKEHVVVPTIEAVIHSLQLADMNGDGQLDIAAAHMHQGEPPQEVVVFINEGKDTRWSNHVVSARGSHDILVADFNGDGRPDILGANHSGSFQPVELWLNQSTEGAARSAEFAAQRQQVLALGELTTPPVVHDAEGSATENGMKAIYFDALPWKGNPTRVFAWLGLPAQRDVTVPGIVLVHGGGGTAFREWVKLWNERGYAAISIAVEGQTDEQAPAAPNGRQVWMRHAWPGPPRAGIYEDVAEPLTEQWMYHAVADTVLANSLLRSLPEVDAERVGLMGISWGGVITSTVMGIDARFAFAIPTYGCGHLFDADNQYGRALGTCRQYREVWDPMVRMSRVHMPVLWLSWPKDSHFPLDCQSHCYRAAPGAHMVALIPGMQHSHTAAWAPPDSYAFADCVTRDKTLWCQQVSVDSRDKNVHVAFAATRPLENASLFVTADAGFTGNRNWTESSATLERRDSGWLASATLPYGTTAWFMNVRSGSLTASSDYQEIGE